jgi:hypothetical protein
MKRLLFIFIASLLIVSCAANDRGLERAREYGELYRLDLPVFNSPICVGHLCIE